MGGVNSTAPSYSGVRLTPPESNFAFNLRSQLGLSRQEFKQLLASTIALGATALIMYYVQLWVLERMNEGMSGSSDKRNVEKILRKLGKLTRSQTLTSHEVTFARKLAFRALKPDNSEDVSFDTLGGLDLEIDAIRQAIIRPIERRRILGNQSQGPISSELSATLQNYNPTMGMLLYGPPGTGKTALVKAVAAELDVAFLPIAISQIMDKYVGESNKYVAAIFSLAAKVAPCVIFLDEVDALFGHRDGHLGDLSSGIMVQLKSQFLSLWDGLETRSESVILIGATNRPQAIDSAFNRRFTTKLRIGVPNADQISDILKKKFAGNDTSLITDANWAMLGNLGSHYGCTGADIKQVREDLARVRIDRYLETVETLGAEECPDLPQLTFDDIRDSLARIGGQKSTTKL